MRMRVLISCLFFSACLLAAVPATAGDIDLGPVWPTSWVHVVDQLGMAPASKFDQTYVATANETGMITDLFVVGDSYTVFVNGNPVLTTPVVPDWTTYDGGVDGCGGNGQSAPCPYTSDPNVAWGNPVWSQGTFALTVGDVVTIQEDTLPTGYTDGTYAITATTPEPCSIVLFGTLLGLAALRRRMKSV